MAVNRLDRRHRRDRGHRKACRFRSKSNPRIFAPNRYNALSMSVRYTISCDEFLECCQDNLPGPNIPSFVGTLFIGVGTGTFGAVLTYTVDPGSKLLASIFCWIGVVLLGLAFWDLKIGTRRRRERLLKEYRATYERLLKDEFTFDFDEQKFTFESAKGKGEVPWEGLLSAVERRNVMTLGKATMVPKRVLGATELEKLRNLAMPNMGMRWSFQIGFVDYLLTETASRWRRHPVFLPLIHGSGIFFCCLIFYQMFNSTGPGVRWGWMIAFAFLFLTVTAQFWDLLIKYRTTHAELSRPRELTFSERGLKMTTARTEWFSAWQPFTKFRETGRAFLLYIDRNQYHLLPKACLTPEQQATFRQILEAKLTRE